MVHKFATTYKEQTFVGSNYFNDGLILYDEYSKNFAQLYMIHDGNLADFQIQVLFNDTHHNVQLYVNNRLTYLVEKTISEVGTVIKISLL